LLGVTGSGKTFTIANVSRENHRPTLRYLAQQDRWRSSATPRFKTILFAENAVEYVGRYFDITSREAYIHATTPTEQIRRLMKRSKRLQAFDGERAPVGRASSGCKRCLIYGVTSPRKIRHSAVE